MVRVIRREIKLPKLNIMEEDMELGPMMTGNKCFINDFLRWLLIIEFNRGVIVIYITRCNYILYFKNVHNLIMNFFIKKL